jgi:hypothetical protein
MKGPVTLGTGILCLGLAMALSAADVAPPPGCSLISAKEIEQVLKGGVVTLAPQDLKDKGPMCNFWDEKGQGGMVHVMPEEKFANVQQQASTWKKSAYVPDPPETIEGLNGKAIFMMGLWWAPTGKRYTINVTVMSAGKMNRDLTLALAKKLKL